MKTANLYEFRSIGKNDWDKKTLSVMHTIGTLLQEPSFQRARDYVFRAVVAPKSLGFSVSDVKQDYCMTMGKKVLTNGEELLCAELGELIRFTSNDINAFRRIVAHIVEFYWYSKKCKKYKTMVLHESHLFVHGIKIDLYGVSEIDISVDALDYNNEIHMTECTTSANRLQHKTEQLEFYALGFKEIRGVVGNMPRLKFELVAGYTTPRSFKYVTPPTALQNANVEMVGISIVDGTEEVIL